METKTMTKMVSWMSDEKQCDKHQKKLLGTRKLDASTSI